MRLDRLTAASISGKVLEGCKTACQYPLDKLQTTFNSMVNLLPLLIIAAGLLIYFIWSRKKIIMTVGQDGPLNYRLWKIPALIAFGVTLLRFLLEKLSSPEALAEVVGIGWLTYLVAIYLALRVHRWRELLANLALFILAARIPIIFLMVFASYLHWGTHYDISSLTHLDTQWGRLNYHPNSFRQHLHIIYLAQLFIMPLYSLATGMMAGAGIFALKWLRDWYQAKAHKKVVFDGQ